MQTRERSYTLAAELALEGFAAALSQRFELEDVAERRVRRTYADTFDARLWAAGARLWAEREGSRRALFWRTPEGEERVEARRRELPEFAREAGGLRAALERTAKQRRLFARLRVDSEEREICVRDASGRLVVRAELERASARRAEARGAHAALRDRVRVREQPGCALEFERVVAFCGELPGLQPAEGDRFDAALGALGLEPARAPRAAVELGPELSTWDAFASIQRALLAAIRAHEPGVRRAWDSEFLHDFRVAVRRARSLLTQVKGVLDTAAFERFKRDFRWLAEQTGPARDLDVLARALPGYLADLDPRARKALADLPAHLARERKRAQKELADTLGSKRYQRLIGDWRALLEAPRPERSGARAALPIAEVARERTAKAWQRARKHALALGPASAASEVHELRIDAKKLRYLLEFFRDVLGPADAEPLIAALRGMQDLLGDFHDYVAHAAILRRRALEADGRSELLAWGQLLEHLRALAELRRAGLAPALARFTEQKQRAERLIAPRPALGAPLSPAAR